MRSACITTAPYPQGFFAVSANKATLLSFLCNEWCENEKLQSALGPTHLYLGGGFKEETRSVVIKEGSIEDVPALESTQQEADTRIILHTLYSIQCPEAFQSKTENRAKCIPSCPSWYQLCGLHSIMPCPLSIV